MRSKEFTFKKTKKVVTEVRALEVNLTEQEASDLLQVLNQVGGHSAAREQTFTPLTKALASFIGVARDGLPEIPPRVVFSNAIYSRDVR